MVNNYYAGFKSSELVNEALLKDFMKYSIDIPEHDFTKDNYRAYTCAINTWLNLIQDIVGFIPSSIPRYIADNGLSETIRVAVAISDGIKKNSVNPEQLHCFGPIWKPLLDRYDSGLIDESDFLIVFEYLKRFSPEGVTVAASSTVDSFLKRNRYAKTQNLPDGKLSNLQHRVMQYMKPTIEGIEKHMTGNYVNELTSPCDCTLPNGNCFEGSKTVAQKLLTCESYLSNLLPLSGVREYQSEGCHTSRFQPVPKTHEKSRGIALEQVYRTVASTAIAEDVTKALYKYSYGRIDLHDQERNRILCKRAAQCGLYATLDWSAASDSVYLCHVRELFTKYGKDLCRWRPEQVIIDGKTYRLNLFATMGSRLTFPVESAIFLAICEGAYRYYENLTGEALDYASIGIYGDDCIVDCRVVDIVFWFAKVLGLTVNTDKSYYSESQRIQVLHDARYRESCGVEYVMTSSDHAARDISHPYYPRKGIKPSSAGVVSLINLQHKLIKYPATNEWLVQFCRSEFNKVFPDELLTESYPESDYSDIWSYWPVITRRNHPIHDDEIIDEDRNEYEIHTVFKPVYHSSRNVPFVEREAAYRYSYYQFLKNGNISDDPLLSLLGCTTPLTPVRNLYCELDEGKVSVGYTL